MKLKHDVPVSSFAFNFNLRPYVVERYNVSTVVLASDNQHAVDACQAKPYRCVALAMDRAAEGMGRGRRSLLSSGAGGGIDLSSFEAGGGGDSGGGGGSSRKLLAHLLPRGRACPITTATAPSTLYTLVLLVNSAIT